MRKPIPRMSAFAAWTRESTWRTLPPVVKTSSMMRVFSPGESVKPRSKMRPSPLFSATIALAPEVLQRPIAKHRLADNVLLRHVAPYVGIEAVVSIIAEHEVLTVWDDLGSAGFGLPVVAGRSNKWLVDLVAVYVNDSV